VKGDACYKALENIQGYYSTASTKLTYDVPLIGDPQSRVDQYVRVTRHRERLSRDAPFMTVAFADNGFGGGFRAG